MLKFLLSITALLTSICINAKANDVKSKPLPDGTVMVMMPYDKGENIMNMTGFIINNTKDSNGNRYIITARHGIKGDENQGFSNITGIDIYSWDKTLIGKADVAFCDDKWGDVKTNIEHDFCVLEIKPQNSNIQYYNTLNGYNISKELPSITPTFCNSGIISWTHGASGSPLIINGMVFGLLSATYDEKTVSYTDWKSELEVNKIKLPKRVVNSDEPKNITIKSCAIFPIFSPKTIAFLQLNSYYKAEYIKKDTPYDTFGFPLAFRSHIFKE